jgi:ABC-2 type transport system ATP-binding protein
MNDDLRAFPAALSAQQVCLRYDEALVLNNLSLDLPAGAVVGLVGRNGAGKSSLLRCFLGLSVPQSGSLTVLGDSAKQLTDGVRERLGYVPQQADLVDWMSVWQHIEYIGSFYSQWQLGRAQSLCERLELPMHPKVKNLSVGDKQKLAIVLALAHDPELLLMDEPVASLDPMMRRAFMQVLFDTQKLRTVLISSHLLSDLERVVSHVAFMRNGRIQLMGGWDELAENLRIVRLPISSPLLANALTHRALGEDSPAFVQAIVDTRLSAFRTLADDMVAPTLDDLFVELNA